MTEKVSTLRISIILASMIAVTVILQWAYDLSLWMSGIAVIIAYSIASVLFSHKKKEDKWVEVTKK